MRVSQPEESGLHIDHQDSSLSSSKEGIHSSPICIIMDSMPTLDDKLATLRGSLGLKPTANADEVIAHAANDSMLATHAPTDRSVEAMIDALMCAREAWQDAGLL